MMMDEKTSDTSAILATKGDEAPSVAATHVSMFDKKATKKLLRKLDWHILPFMSLIYLLCFLDRTNIGNARLDGLEQDLDLQGLQYNDCLAVLFPFYISAEIPSNMMMKRLRPSVWLTFIMVAWSACMIGQGFVKNYAGLMTMRALLGLFEGGLFPGVSYYGDGVGGLSAWSWIFILEGILSILIAFTAYWAIYDYPSIATFVTEKERDEVERRLAADNGHHNEDFDVKYVWQALGDWKIYVFMLIFLADFAPIYSLSLFLPTIIRGLGYSAHMAQLMSVPPYVLACVFTIGTSLCADRARQRGAFVLAFHLVAILGFALLAASGNSNVQYTGTIVAAIGLYSQIPLCLAWNSANIGGSLKRGTGIAMQVMGGNAGGIVASYVYLPHDSPRYTKGHSIVIGFLCMAFALALFMTIWCRCENARRDAVAPQVNGNQELTEEQKMLERDLADNVPWFRYTV